MVQGSSGLASARAAEAGGREGAGASRGVLANPFRVGRFHLGVHDRLASRIVKRAVDVGFSVLGLIVLSPILALIAIAIRLESPGAAVFRQVRLGRNGRPFTFYKFRTMRQDNDSSIHRNYVERLITEPSDTLKGDSGSFKIEDDPRITRLGAVLRRTSLDELPQLLNVVTGDMSLVGPRPPLAYEANLYTPHARRRLECKPGITGLWQISGRSRTTFDRMVELDIEYIETWSLALDLKILLRTPLAVVDGGGAC